MRGNDAKSIGNDSKKANDEYLKINNLRDLSCLLRCSLLLKARLQNWHLYFFSGANDDDDDDLRIAADVAAVGRTVILATGMLIVCC